METVVVGATPRVVDVQAANLQLVDEYLHWCQHKRGRSAETVRAYGSTLRKLADWSTVLLLDLSVEDMERFANRPRERGWRNAAEDAPRKPASVRQTAAILRSFYRWAWERNYTTEHAASHLHGPTVKNVNPRPIPDHAWLRLWGIQWKRKGGEPFLNDETVAMLGLGFFVGLRRSELASLTAAQWDGSSLFDFVRKGGGEHTLDVAAILDVYEVKLPHLLGDRADFLLSLDRLAAERPTGPMLGLTSKDAVNRSMALLCKAAGVGLYTPHQLRHSAATNLLRAGVPLHLVQSVMNHSSPAVTMRYVRAGGSELREWLGRDSDGGHS